MPFRKDEISELLAKCHRRCCVCHRFCGVKMEIHHIEHKSDGGLDNIDNAIPLCFECHAEVNHYNDKHPKGRKFSNIELFEHKKQWLDICKKYPNALVSAPRDVDVGPLEGMLLELEYNENTLCQIINGASWHDEIGCILHDDEYKRSIAQGSLLLLTDELKQSINNAYAEVGRINTFVAMYSNTRPEGNAFAEATNRLLEAYRKSEPIISLSFSELNKFLSNRR